MRLETTEKITPDLLDRLTAQAKAAPNRCMDYNLCNFANDLSQRVLTAIEPESVVSMHRHQKSSETVVCLRGRVVEEFYDNLEQRCVETSELSPNGPVVALNIPAGQWHKERALESGTVIMVVKDGKSEKKKATLVYANNHYELSRE